MNDALLHNLLTTLEAAIETAKRNVDIARALAQGYRAGVHPPENVMDAYLASMDRDETRLAEWRAVAGRYRAVVT